jgi:hypothetical protein
MEKKSSLLFDRSHICETVRVNLLVHSMHRRTYSYTSTWSDPDELLESARQSVKTIQHLGSQVVDGFWGIVSKSQEWINNNNNKGHGNVADRRVSEEMDVHVVMVIRASVVLEGGRSRVS